MEQGTNRSKRALLRGALFGTAACSAQALPDRWIRPVVDTAILPAHAQATGATEFTANFTVFDVMFGMTPGAVAPGALHASTHPGSRLLDAVVPQARAGNGSDPGTPAVVAIRIVSRNPDRFDVLIIRDFTNEYTDEFVVHRGTNLEMNGFTEIPFLGSSSCVGDTAAIRIDSIGEVITGRLRTEGVPGFGSEGNFTAAPGAWPALPSLAENCSM